MQRTIPIKPSMKLMQERLYFKNIYYLRRAKTKSNIYFILEDLFKKANLSNIYSEFLSNKIEEIGIENLPERYQETATSRIISDDNLIIGKIKYNDKILHQSKILKYFVEGENKKKVQKDIDKIFKRVSKNNKYFISAKDLALS